MTKKEQKEQKEQREWLLQNSEYKLNEVMTYLGCLHSEDSITSNTYNYLWEQLLYVLNNLIQDELYEN